jgi:hypothetical protein
MGGGMSLDEVKRLATFIGLEQENNTHTVMKGGDDDDDHRSDSDDDHDCSRTYHDYQWNNNHHEYNSTPVVYHISKMTPCLSLLSI